MLINSMKTLCFQSAENVIFCKEWENSTDSIFGVVGVELSQSTLCFATGEIND